MPRLRVHYGPVETGCSSFRTHYGTWTGGQHVTRDYPSSGATRTQPRYSDGLGRDFYPTPSARFLVSIAQIKLDAGTQVRRKHASATAVRVAVPLLSVATEVGVDSSVDLEADLVLVVGTAP